MHLAKGTVIWSSPCPFSSYTANLALSRSLEQHHSALFQDNTTLSLSKVRLDSANQLEALHWSQVSLE